MGFAREVVSEKFIGLLGAQYLYSLLEALRVLGMSNAGTCCQHWKFPQLLGSKSRLPVAVMDPGPFC